MGMDYNLILVLGVELEHGNKKLAHYKQKWHPDTGVPYMQQFTKDVDTFSLNGKELFQMEMEDWDWRGHPLNKELYKELEILPENVNLYVSKKSILGVQVAETESESGGGNLTLAVPDLDKIKSHDVLDKLKQLGIDTTPSLFIVLAISS